MKGFLRVYKELDIEEVNKHIVIAGDLTGVCGNCSCVGINYFDSTSCPDCNTEFRYVSLQGKNIFNLLKRIKDKRPEVIFIDYEDYKKLKGKFKAKEFFQK